MQLIRIGRRGCVLLIPLACAGCLVPGGRSRTRAEIADVLGQQAASWNAGNIEAFMRPYWHSPDLTFSSGGWVTRGWESTVANYRKRYPTRAAMGHLSFSNLEISQLGGDTALVLGRWRLEREKPIGGAFTLVMRKVDGRWVIIHDHTSRRAQ